MNISLPQPVPREFCLQCDVCCRYSEQFSAWSPFILKEELNNFRPCVPQFIESYGINIAPVKRNGRFVCPFFDLKNNRCRIYPNRPFDCRMYPFLVSYNSNYTHIILAASRQCPFVADKKNLPVVMKHAKALKDILEKEEAAEMLYLNKGLIMPYSGNIDACFSLDKVSTKIFAKDSDLKAMSLGGRGVFQGFLGNKKARNFSHTFEYIYGWRDVAHILWNSVDDNLLVFWRQGGDSFLLLPPAGKNISPRALEFSKEFLRNHNSMRVENVNEEDGRLFRQYGFRTRHTGSEYIYTKNPLIGLRGNRFKSPRWASNYFRKNFKSQIRNLTTGDIGDCLALLEVWVGKRIERCEDRYYRLLIEDNFFAQRRLMLEFDNLEIAGNIIQIDGRIAAYSFGYPIDSDTFCIFAEVAERGFKGISEYLFREFCRNLSAFKLINLMDDAGLNNLRRKKMSYHPARVNALYTATSVK